MSKLREIIADKKVQFFLLALAVVLFLFNLVFVYNKYSHKAIFGLRLDQNNISLLSKKQILELVKNKFRNEKPLKLIYANRVIKISRRDIGAEIDYQRTVDRLFEEGKNENPLINIFKQTQAFLGLTNLPVKGSLSRPLLTLTVLDIANQLNREPQPAMPDFAGDWMKTVPQQEGLKVDSSKLSRIITDNIFNPPDNPIIIPTKKISKSFGFVDMAKIRKQAAEYTSQPITIKSGGVIFSLMQNDLKSMLVLAEEIDPLNPKKTILVVELDRKKLNQKLDVFAERVEKATNAEFNDHDARAAIYGQFYTNTRRTVDVLVGSNSSQVLGVATKPFGQKTVYITIDDGPNIVYHPMLLDILKEKGVKATFYLVGSNSKLYKNTTRRTIAEGHAIGDHSLTHAYLPKLLPNQIFDEIKTTRDILNNFLTEQNKVVSLFRPPYGGTNQVVAKDVTDLGMKTEFWSIDPRDWTDPSTEVLVKRVVDKAKDQDIILLHSNHFSTVRALPLIIDGLRAKGFQFNVQQ